MRDAYRTIADVLRSPWAGLKTPSARPEQSDRVLRATKLEDSIYGDLRRGDAVLDQIEQDAAEKMATFPALSRDVYQSFYSLLPRRVEEADLSTAARKMNAPLLDHIQSCEDYPALKSVCEGRELPAYEAASEFISQVAGDLDGLLSGLAGEKGAVRTLDRLERAAEKAETELSSMLERLNGSSSPNETLERAIVAAANTAESKRRQAQAVGKLIDVNRSRERAAVGSLVAHAVTSAAERAREVQSVIAAWSDEPGHLEKTQANEDLLALVRNSDVLREVSKYLGRFRELFANGKRNGYAYGRGEKYTLELGRDLTRALSSELAMLASPETLPLFLRKYQRGQVKQYQRREPIYQGAGDIICCLDESDSTCGAPAAWGKAVALTLLEIAADGHRSFALIHFSGRGSFRTDLFRPGAYTAADKMAAAEVFLGGGTDFQTPMDEALRLMGEEGFERADVVFVTDGACALPAEYLVRFREEQKSRRFTVTGILLDEGCAGMDFSLHPFCQDIYRTSELTGETIVENLIQKRV